MTERDFKPSDVFFAMSEPPFSGQCGDPGRERGFALVVRAMFKHGNAWQNLSVERVYASIKEEASGYFYDVRAHGWEPPNDWDARWNHATGVEITDGGFALLRKWVAKHANAEGRRLGE